MGNATVYYTFRYVAGMYFTGADTPEDAESNPEKVIDMLLFFSMLTLPDI